MEGIREKYGERIYDRFCEQYDRINLNFQSFRQNTNIVKVSDVAEFNIDFDKLVEIYHDTCRSLPRIEYLPLTLEIKRKIALRQKEMCNDFKKLLTVFRKAEMSDLLNGRNPHGCRASFDWFFENDTNWVKVLEGCFDNKPKNENTSEESEF
jgi:hypothetical protein